MTFRACRILSLVTLHLVLMAESGVVSAETEATKTGKTEKASRSDPSGVTDVVSIDQLELFESSGLAVSRVRDSHFWSHNDSGGKPILYALNSRGENTGRITFESVTAVDWEDIASFVDRGTPRLLVADCGDNVARRESITLHLIDEPDPKKSTTVKNHQIISVSYIDGPRDCEAVAVDTARGKIILITKSVFPLAGAYVVPLPKEPRATKIIHLTAQRIGTIPLPMVTAMDVDPRNGDIHVVSYFQAFRFACRRRNMPIAQQLSSMPSVRDLPRWSQIEAMAIDKHQDVWVTSEGEPAPMGRLPKQTAASKRP